MLVAHSYSPLTIYELRFGKLREQESNQQRIQRFSEMFAIPDVEVKILMAASDDNIDLYGRIPE